MYWDIKPVNPTRRTFPISTPKPFEIFLRELLTTLPHSHTHIFYSRPTDSDRRGADYTAAGRVSAAAFGALGLPHSADAYLCGPAAFTDALSAALSDYGLDPARIQVEIFGAGASLTPGIAEQAKPPHPPHGLTGTGPSVAFVRSGLIVAWHPRYRSLLNFAEACDVPVRWSCRTGVCHNCETALLSGTVTYDPEPVDPPAEGNVLTCCARPGGDLVLDL